MVGKTREDGLKKIEKIQRGVTDLSDLDQELHCLLALGCLGGESKKIHTEEIAVQLYEWFPKMYGWKLPKYNIYPDKQLPKRGLSYLRTYEWVAGSFNENILKDGWMLTSQGQAVYKMIANLHQSKKSNESFSKKDLEYLNRRIGNSALYKKFLKAVEYDMNFIADVYDLSDFLSVSVGMDKHIRISFYDLYRKADNLSEKDYLSFLNSLRENHEDLLDHAKFVDDSRSISKKKIPGDKI
jgi:hypothetical protein